MPLKIDLHVHTIYSHDGLITPNQLVWQLKKKGLDGVAITDHDTVRGVSKFLKKLAKYGFLVIPGVEVTAKNVHIIGLNVTANVPSGLETRETVNLIHEAGGLAVIAHPTAVYKGWTKHLFRKFDAVEVINSSSFPFLFSVYFNRKIAESLGLPQVAGSDAHYFKEVGSAYTHIDANDPNIECILEAIKKSAAIPCGKAIPLHIRLKREVLVFKKRFSF